MNAFNCKDCNAYKESKEKYGRASLLFCPLLEREIYIEGCNRLSGKLAYKRIEARRAIIANCRQL